MSKVVRKKSKSKLSLRKKGRGDNARVVLIPDVDLDETSEFQHSRHAKATSTFPCTSSLQTEVMQAQDTQLQKRETSKDLSNSDDNVPSDTKSGDDQIDVNRKKKEEEDTSVDDPADTCRCLFCGLFFTQVDLKGHIQKCLQFRFKRTMQPVTGRGDEKMDEVVDKSYMCPFCKRDLSCLNSKLKTRHLNRCIDQEEKEKNMEERNQQNLERAKKAVLSCPICGKPCKTEKARKVHLKKCATTNRVMTDQVLKLVKDQEVEHRLKLAAGIIPPDIGNMKNAEEVSTASTRNKKFKEPKSQFDEDTQLAMAISSSLDHDKTEKETDLIGQMLSYDAAWNMQVQDENRMKKKRKKREPEGIPPLLALSEEEKTRRQQLRVSNLLVSQDEAKEPENTPSMADSKLQKQTGSTHLWISSSLEKKQTGDFYVFSLMPPIEKSKAVMGTKIKSLPEIPGRRSVLLSNQDEQIYKKSDGDMIVPKDELMATTQTAVVLAELAEEADDEILDTTLHCSGFCPERTIKIKSSTQNEAVSSLQTDMLGLVNNPSGSDVTVLVSNSDKIYAHTVILSCRCPILLQLRNGSEISFSDVSSEVMLAVLQFVYTGHISLYHSNVNQVLSLSKRLHLDELKTICEEALPQTSNEMERSSDDQNSDLDTINNHQSGVDKLLKDVWGENDDDNSEIVHQETSSEVSPNESDEGYNDVTSSQILHSINKHSDEAKEKSALDIKHSNRTQTQPVCECEDEGDNLNMKEEKLQQEINNFFQDESFDITCEVQKEESLNTKTRNAKNKSRSLIFENIELAVFSDSSDSDSPVCKNIESSGQFNNTGKMRENKNDNQTRGEIMTEVKEDTIIICSDESDNVINDDQNLKSGYVSRNDTGQYSPQLVPGKSCLFSNRDVTHLFDNSSDGPWKEALDRSESSPTKTFKHSEDNSLARLSPDLIEEGNAECSFLILSSPSRKLTRSARTIKRKSPVVVLKSPALSTPTANSSGLDLFGSLSPCNKQRKTDSPEKIEATSTHSFLYQENSCTRKLFVSDEHSNPSDSQQLCEVEHIGGNLHQTFQSSPIFQGKAKKKCIMEVMSSPMRIQNLSPKGKLRRNTDLVLHLSQQGERTSTNSQENKAVCIDASPVKYSQENDCDITWTSAEVNQDVLIPKDVWDDFDDNGAGFGGTFDIPPVTPMGHNSSFDQDELNLKTNSRNHQSPADQTPKLQHLEKAIKHFQDTSQRTDCDHSVMLGDDNTPNMSVKNGAVSQAKMKAVLHWVPPSPLTPMPQYDSMNTPQLKREVQKIGVRPVGKKRMVALLKDVYDKTHQYETDSNVEEEVDEENEKGQSSCMKEKEADELNSSQESSHSDMMEESYLHGSMDDLVLSQASQQDDSALSEKLYQFVKSSADIYRKILMYEPLEVDWLKKEITEVGIKCSMQKLLSFLDEKCITFTMKKMRKERNSRRGKGRGKASPKKGTDLSQQRVSSK